MVELVDDDDEDEDDELLVLVVDGVVTGAGGVGL
jgi:hypothetical protein